VLLHSINFFPLACLLALSFAFSKGAVAKAESLAGKSNTKAGIAKNLA
jgi:hypothetical protein